MYCTRSPLQTSTDVPSGTVSLFSSDRTKAGALAPALALSDSYRMLGGGDVRRLHPLTSLGRLVGDLGTLVEGLEALAGYAGVVHEEILAPIIRGDKAVALLVAEPLHCSLGHNQAPTFRVYGPPPNKMPPSIVLGGGAPSNVNPPCSYVTRISITEFPGPSSSADGIPLALAPPQDPAKETSPPHSRR